MNATTNAMPNPNRLRRHPFMRIEFQKTNTNISKTNRHAPNANSVSHPSDAINLSTPTKMCTKKIIMGLRMSNASTYKNAPRPILLLSMIPSLHIG